MPWAVAAAAGVGVVGSVLQGNAAEKAADSAIATQRASAAQARADLAPWTAAGANALAPQQALLGLQGPEAAAGAMANFTASPGYQYALDQGVRAVQGSAAAGGMLHSGATLKAIQDRGMQLASQDFGTYYNRLAALANTGQASAAGQAASATQAGAGIAQTQMAEGQAVGNMYAGVASSIGGGVNTYLNNSMYDRRTNALMSR